MSENSVKNDSSFDVITPKEVLASAYSAFNQPAFESILKIKEISSFEELKKYLAEKIAVMMDKNFDLLLSSLYRIDIDEKKITDLFSGSNRDYIPEKLAEFVIARQMQKIYYRNLYRKQSADIRIE